MATDGERALAARRLRAAADDWRGLEPYDGPTRDIARAVAGGGRCATLSDALERMADLVEPRDAATCRNVSGEEGEFACSNCGDWIHTDLPLQFCPFCGAMIEEADDGDE